MKLSKKIYLIGIIALMVIMFSFNACASVTHENVESGKIFGVYNNTRNRTYSPGLSEEQSYLIQLDSEVSTIQRINGKTEYIGRNSVIVLKPGDYTIGVNYTGYVYRNGRNVKITGNISIDFTAEPGQYYFLTTRTEGDQFIGSIGNLSDYDEVKVRMTGEGIPIPSSLIIAGMKEVVEKKYK